MIRLRLGSADLQQMRFAYSPLGEAAAALYMLHSGRVPPTHLRWLDAARPAIQRTDTALLQAALPARGDLAQVFFTGPTDATTTIDHQLRQIAEYPPDRLAVDLGHVWRGTDLPAAARPLVSEGSDGTRRLADAMGAFWQAAIAPFWSRIRAVLDADVAYRATQMAHAGIGAMVSGLHPKLVAADTVFEVRSGSSADHDLTGQGLFLIPSAFAWPWLIVDAETPGAPSLTYGARGVATLWESSTARPGDDDPPTDLLGRSRAAILHRLDQPRTTTELAGDLRQSPATVSAHLAILRRSGMVSSWRSGRRVLYQRTPLATSVLTATGVRRAPEIASTA